MRENFDKAFQLVIGLEGKPSNDPDDPGGFTIWGLSQVYNPEVNEHTTIEQAKEIYLKKYWIPAGCDGVTSPMDICLFDGAVNPMRGGNKELLTKNPENWQDFLLLRAVRYMKYSKDIYKKGHVFRVLKLFEQIRED
jgi:lysozyme family protein